MEYKEKLKWFVYDVMGVYLYHNPGKYLELDCRWNYLTDHCKSGQLCENAHKYGVAILHGSKNSFFSNAEPTFRVVFSAFKDYKFNTELRNNLLIPLKNNLEKVYKDNISNSKCGQFVDIFTKCIENFVEE